MATKKIQCVFSDDVYARIKAISGPLTPCAFHIRQAVDAYLERIDAEAPTAEAQGASLGQ